MIVKMNILEKPISTRTIGAPKVSVIMSTYNGGPYLREAVESILNQTYEDLEFIIIDDASTDDTAAILKSFQDDQRIRIHRNETNLGLAKSLNKAINLARGLYIARQDADDISIFNRLACQVEFLDQHAEIAAVCTTTQWIDSNGFPIRVWHQPIDNASIQKTLLRYCCLLHATAMFRADLLRSVNGYDVHMRTGQDYDLWLRISEKFDIASLDDVLYLYRRHSDMASVKRGAEQNRNAQEGLTRALRRREPNANFRLLFDRNFTNSPFGELSRSQIAQRYVWWSSGARAVSRWLALKFLLFAIILDPTTPDIWQFVGEVFLNKVKKFKKGVHVEA